MFLLLRCYYVLLGMSHCSEQGCLCKGEPLTQRGWWGQWRTGCSHLSAALCGHVSELPFPVAHNGLLPFPSAPEECGEGLKITSLGSAVLGKSRQLPSVSSGVGFKKPARESFSWLCLPKSLHLLPAHPLKLPFLCLQLVRRCCPTDGSHQPGRLHLPGDIREDSAAAALSQPGRSCGGRSRRSRRAGGGVWPGAEPSSRTPHSSCPAG